jgi:hypothetical protein
MLRRANSILTFIGGQDAGHIRLEKRRFRCSDANHRVARLRGLRKYTRAQRRRDYIGRSQSGLTVDIGEFIIHRSFGARVAREEPHRGLAYPIDNAGAATSSNGSGHHHPCSCASAYNDPLRCAGSPRTTAEDDRGRLPAAGPTRLSSPHQRRKVLRARRILPIVGPRGARRGRKRRSHRVSQQQRMAVGAGIRRLSAKAPPGETTLSVTRLSSIYSS